MSIQLLCILWYGSNPHYRRLSKTTLTNSFKFNLKKKFNSKFITKKFIYQPSIIYLYIPSFWKYTIFKKKKSKLYGIFLYSNLYYFFIPINLHLIKLSSFLNSSVISFFFFFQHNFINTFFNIFKKTFFSFSKIFFKKIKFKGKGYYVYKNKRNTIAFRFGYSHIKRLYFFYTHLKFLSKTSIIVFGYNYNTLTSTIKNIKNVRPINIFTAKGIRFTRQILYRKTGKVSSYR